MADKSPRQHMSKKAGKSLKEKRAEKHLKAEAKNKTQIVSRASSTKATSANGPELHRPLSRDRLVPTLRSSAG